MKTARLITRTVHLLGVALLLACADNTTAPAAKKTVPTGTKATRVIDLSSRPKLKATVTTVISSRDKSGKMVQRKRFSQRVTATFNKRGLAEAKVDVASADLPNAMFASMTDGGAAFAQYTSDPTAITPVLAITGGAIAWNYADTVIDSGGNVLEFYGWAPYEGTPITDGWAYRNGMLVAQYHASWGAVTNGYVLADQTVGSYLPDGTLAGTVYSTVSGGGGGGSNCGENGCPLEMKNDESLGEKLAAPLRLALDKVGCWLSPQVAYAMIQCTWEAVDFGLHSYTLYEMTRVGLPFWGPGAAGAYFTEWGFWTQSMYRLGYCLDSQRNPIRPRGSSVCRTNPRACSGGGGSTW